MQRRVSAALFALGVLLAVGFGCLLAAYDLWGGVPRRLWPFARWSAAGALLCLVLGGGGFIASWPPGQRLRAGLRSAAVLGSLGLLAGAALWFHYAARLRTSQRICAPALIAPTSAEREAALARGLGPLFPVIDPASSCIQLLREKQELARDRTCPTFVMENVPCMCGTQRWIGGAAAVGRCPNGPTACQYRDGAQTLGCAEHGSLMLLKEARDAQL